MFLLLLQTKRLQKYLLAKEIRNAQPAPTSDGARHHGTNLHHPVLDEQEEEEEEG